MPLLVAVLLGLAALALVVYPLVDTSSARRDRNTPAALATLDAEAGAKQALRDVDFDHRLGNLDEADYLALRARYEGRALAAMKARYDQERAADALIDERLAALQTASAPPADRRAEKVAKSASAPRGEPATDSAAGVANGGAASPSASGRARRTPADKPGLRRRRGV
jgi:hypothetical protein